MNFFILSFLFLSSTLVASEYEINLKSEKPLQHFIALQNYDLTSYDAMLTIFSSTSLDFKKLSAGVQTDIIRCKRYIRMHPKNCEQHKVLLQHLRSFFYYLKKHKHCCAAIQFHNDIQDRYTLAFKNQNIVHSINTTPHLYGISERCKHKCKEYFNRILLDLSKINKFEDYLHGDFSQLKAQNYVYKIELVKLRNSIYHNNRYKYEVSYF